ncbi:hypothetical protein HKK55_18360 [Pseudomonas sp. ADAK18]|uniref:hypothetical protein n=1 Tax=Pseudomonas sp. ADAK18 TaxID=2730848 RepID=UPI0014628CBB|nr:hypothetical protein [Pseudomonas sp. ADAK18]QJI27169.1 hypothetical protein HKK55_18360 [Pseudomonas sp. ADAK18]
MAEAEGGVTPCHLRFPDDDSYIRRYKSLFVIYSAVSCQGFLKARNHLRLKKQTLRGATTMHEIPNLPFPSLHETEQPTPQQANSKQPEPVQAKPVDSESQD